MASTTEISRPRRPASPPAATPAQDGVTVLTGTWLVLGLFSDGWAHSNVASLDSFFTPWHAALYAGFLASAAWIGWLGRDGLRGRQPRDAFPVGYGLGAVGVLVFVAGGVADMLWHVSFGVEVGLDALLSPSHLILFAGGLLILTSALRSRWAQGDTYSWWAVGSLVLATLLVAFFLLYVSEFVSVAPTIDYARLPEGSPGHEQAQLPAIAGLASFLITTAVIVVPVLLLLRRGLHRFGSVTAVVAPVAWLSAAVVHLSPATIAGAAGATLGAVVADAALAGLERRRGLSAGGRLPIAAAVVALTVWTAHTLALGLVVGLAWPVELWAGVIMVSTMSAGLLGHLTQGVAPVGEMR